MSVRHVQSQPIEDWVFWMLVAFAIGCLGWALIPALAWSMRVVLVGVAGITLGVSWLMARLTVVVTDVEVLGGFRFPRIRVPLSVIRDVRVIEARFWKHGIGFHVLIPAALAFVARPGPAVRIERTGRCAVRSEER